MRTILLIRIIFHDNFLEHSRPAYCANYESKRGLRHYFGNKQTLGHVGSQLIVIYFLSKNYF